MTTLTASPTTTAASTLTAASTPSAKALWAGRILTGLLAVFFVWDGAMKLIQAEVVREAMVRLGFPASATVPIGLTLIACTALWLVPRTAIVGALGLTAYLGGAVCTHVHTGAGAFPIVFAVAFGVLVWTALFLRLPRTRALVLGDQRRP